MTFTLTLVSATNGVTVGATPVVTITETDCCDTMAPTQPPPPVLVTTTGGSLTITVSPPSNVGGMSLSIVSYAVLVSTSPTGHYTVEASGAAAGGTPAPTTYKVYSVAGAPLRASSTYYVAVAAGNTVGVSVPSTTLVVTLPPASLPTKVNSVAVSGITGGAAIVSFSYPTDWGGGSINAFQVCLYAASASPACTSPPVPASFAVVGGGETQAIGSLLASTSYDVYVFATSAAGAGAGSSVASFTTTSVSVPGPVGGLSIVGANSTGGRVAFTLTAPTDTGGVPRSTLVYSVLLLAPDRRTPVGSAAIPPRAPSAAHAAGSAADEVTSGVYGEIVGSPSALAPATAYVAVATASTGHVRVGAGFIATLVPVTRAAATATDVSTLPQAPRGYLSAGDVFTIDGGNGTLFCVGGGGAPAGTSFALSELHTGAPVAGAVSLLGEWGPVAGTAPWALPTGAASPPEQVRAPLVTSITGGTISLQLLPPRDVGGSAVTGFDVYVASAASSWSYDLVGTAPVGAGDNDLEITYDINYRLALTAYSLRVVAANVPSSCLVSHTASTSPPVHVVMRAGTPPGQPVALGDDMTATASGGSIALVWTAPREFGGTAAVSYNVTRAACPDATPACCGAVVDWHITSAPSATFYGLAPDTGYCVAVLAFNTYGASAFSEPLVSRTSAASSPGTRAGAHVLVSNVCARVPRLHVPACLHVRAYRCACAFSCVTVLRLRL